MRSVEKLANIAVIIAVAAFLVVLARHEFTASPVPPNEASIRTVLNGKKIQLPGLSFPRAHPSMLLALSVGCHFCADSTPFYRRLAAQTRGRLDLVALFPQPQPQAQAYLQQAELPVAKVISAPLGLVQVSGTPTLILVDRGGKVQNVWVGRLDGSRERQVLSRVSVLGG